MHPLRDGAPFLLLLEASPTFGRSVRFFQILHKKKKKMLCFCVLFPSCLAVRGHLSPRMAIVFPLLIHVPNFSMSHPATFLISSSNTFRSSHSAVHILPLRGFYVHLRCHKGSLCAPSSSSTRVLVYLIPLSYFWQVQVEGGGGIVRKSRSGKIGERMGGVGECTQFVHGRSRMTIDPRIPTMPGRSMSGFHQPGRHCLHHARSAVRCSASRMKGELHPTKNRL